MHKISPLLWAGAAYIISALGTLAIARLASGPVFSLRAAATSGVIWGGLMVPLTRTTLFLDVFARWQLPLILCARTKLGTINHTLLSIEAVRSRNIPLHGTAFIGDANAESETIITEIGKVKRLGRLPIIEPLTAARLKAVFAENFAAGDFT